VTQINDEEIQRLANRMAMLVSDDGEADNAGRAVGALARRLGLTGGQLKAIFMAGAESAGVRARELERMRKERDALRASVDDLTIRERRLEEECLTLRDEADALRAALRGQTVARRRGIVVGGALVVLLAGVLTLGMMAPWNQAGGLIPFHHTVEQAPTHALIRDRPVALRPEPDLDVQPLGTLAVGTQLSVRRLLWHGLMQWAEVETGGTVGYVPSTDVQLY
jgi:hypothetical protein